MRNGKNEVIIDLFVYFHYVYRTKKNMSVELMERTPEVFIRRTHDMT